MKYQGRRPKAGYFAAQGVESEGSRICQMGPLYHLLHEELPDMSLVQNNNEWKQYADSDAPASSSSATSSSASKAAGKGKDNGGKADAKSSGSSGNAKKQGKKRNHSEAELEDEKAPQQCMFWSFCEEQTGRRLAIALDSGAIMVLPDKPSDEIEYAAGDIAEFMEGLCESPDELKQLLADLEGGDDEGDSGNKSAGSSSSSSSSSNGKRSGKNGKQKADGKDSRRRGSASSAASSDMMDEDDDDNAAVHDGEDNDEDDEDGDDGQEETVSELFGCDVCAEMISGARWSCAVCANFDLCDACHAKHAKKGAHLPSHKMNRVAADD